MEREEREELLNFAGGQWKLMFSSSLFFFFDSKNSNVTHFFSFHLEIFIDIYFSPFSMSILSCFYTHLDTQRRKKKAQN